MKEQYLQMRQSSHHNMVWYYEYYSNNFKEGIKLDMNLFLQTFPMWFEMNSNNIFQYLDGVFGINILRDKENNIINFYI